MLHFPLRRNFFSFILPVASFCDVEPDSSKLAILLSSIWLSSLIFFKAAKCVLKVSALQNLYINYCSFLGRPSLIVFLCLHIKSHTNLLPGLLSLTRSVFCLSQGRVETNNSMASTMSERKSGNPLSQNSRIVSTPSGDDGTTRSTNDSESLTPNSSTHSSTAHMSPDNFCSIETPDTKQGLQLLDGDS